jgi:N-acetylmuramoyl-L-alanine amidase
VENHTNAGVKENVVDGKGAEGTEVFYCGSGDTSSKSYKLASILYKYIAPISKGGDRGIKPDTDYSPTGLYVVRKTNPPAALVELIFHTNLAEVTDFINHIDNYAKAEAKAIVEYCGEKWIEPITK